MGYNSGERSLVMTLLGGLMVLVGLVILTVGIVGNALWFQLGSYFYQGVWAGTAIILAGVFSLLGSRARSDSLEQGIALVCDVMGVVFSVYEVVHSANRLKLVSDARSADTALGGLTLDEMADAEALLVVLLVFSACALFLSASAMLWFAVHIYGYYFREYDDYQGKVPSRADEYYSRGPRRPHPAEVYPSRSMRY